MMGGAVRSIWRVKRLEQNRYLIINQLDKAENHEKCFQTGFDSNEYVGILNQLEDDLTLPFEE